MVFCRLFLKKIRELLSHDETVALEEKRSNIIVEKDLIQSLFLYELSKNNPSAQLEYNINEMLKEIVDKRFYERDYNFVTNKLLYENYSYEDAINNGIAKVIKTDVFIYKK